MDGPQWQVRVKKSSVKNKRWGLATSLFFLNMITPAFGMDVPSIVGKTKATFGLAFDEGVVVEKLNTFGVGQLNALAPILSTAPNVLQDYLAGAAPPSFLPLLHVTLNEAMGGTNNGGIGGEPSNAAQLVSTRILLPGPSARLPQERHHPAVVRPAPPRRDASLPGRDQAHSTQV